MNRHLSRREFSLAASVGMGALGLPALQGATAPRLKVGHTGITWGYRPEDAEQAIKDVGALGYSGFESFGNIIEAWEPKGGIGRLLDEAKLPLISAYCNVNLTDAARRSAEVEKIVRWGKLIKKYGGSVAVIGPNNVKRPGYDFAGSKANIVAALNDIAKGLADVGIIGALHQHTGTCVEFRDEVYAVLEAVDTRFVKFSPDVGQLLKGGSDPLKVVKDFLPLIRHVHLKDYDGGPYWSAYCPLGRGKVDLPAVLSLLETQKDLQIVMAELDPEGGPPLKPIEAAGISKAYLQKLGYSFRS